MYRKFYDSIHSNRLKKRKAKLKKVEENNKVKSEGNRNKHCKMNKESQYIMNYTDQLKLKFSMRTDQENIQYPTNKIGIKRSHLMDSTSGFLSIPMKMLMK